MQLYNLFVETQLADGLVVDYIVVERAVPLDRATRRRNQLERNGRHCAIQTYRGWVQ